MHRVQAEPFEYGQPSLTEMYPPSAKVSRARQTILLAEDDHDLRYVMQHSLASLGYAVLPAADAYLASAAFRTHGAVDLLLTDYDMPGRTGMELARELSGMQPALPIMIVTGSLLEKGTMTEIQHRKWTFVSKPCKLVALEATLKHLLGPQD